LNTLSIWLSYSQAEPINFFKYLFMAGMRPRLIAIDDQ
jgi:hypothetical protein